MSRYLTIIEVSQKQAYIFSSNKLKDNIERSGEIARITSTEYIQKAVTAYSRDGQSFSEEENLVYTGGGHTILEFPSEDDAKEVIRALTDRVLRELPDIELFARTIPYDEDKTPGENVHELTAALEQKKSRRESIFHQGTFGIEEIDQNTGRPIRLNVKAPDWKAVKESVPDGFRETNEFEKLGGSANQTNFIAVVHIDGNAMGKRVEQLSSTFGKGEWDQYKKQMRLFSEGIARDFRDAYSEMEQKVADVILAGGLQKLNLSEKKGRTYLPVRRIISEGDDICFVSEGRIGVECAVAFINALGGRMNVADNKPYAACAGVALVHQKYPFYRAYQLAEELCSNAKRFGASLAEDGTGSNISSIDWHVEFGELKDTLTETREQYRTFDNKMMELRPYIIHAPEELLEKEQFRQYQHFHDLMDLLTKKEDAYGRGTMKELRPVLKRGEAAVRHYLTFHRIEELGRDIYQGIFTDINYEEIEVGSGKMLERRMFVETADGEERSLLFDAIEMMDTYLPL